jgi:hypothetical protein
VTGNVTLVESNLSAGNIMKGTTPFIHNFGSANTFIGENAGNLTTMSGPYNTASGYRALSANTTGSSNTAAGASALQNNRAGYNNTAVGSGALVSNTDGIYNTAIGVLALENNTTGLYNTALGIQALQFNTVGANNVATGQGSLLYNTVGYNNTASGVSALFSNTTGIHNVASGYQALYSNTTGNFNVAIGANAGFNATTGSNNIHIGAEGAADDTNVIRIGSNQSRTFIAGINGVAGSGLAVVVDSNGQLGTSSLVGTPGPTGPAGPQGVPGIQGPVGLTGPVGPQGVAGTPGAQGAQGPVGLTGSQGPQGATGATGPQGPAGISTLSGDVTGDASLTAVTRLQGTPVLPQHPLPGQSLVFDGTVWRPQTQVLTTSVVDNSLNVLNISNGVWTPILATDLPLTYTPSTLIISYNAHLAVANGQCEFFTRMTVNGVAQPAVHILMPASPNQQVPLVGQTLMVPTTSVTAGPSLELQVLNFSCPSLVRYPNINGAQTFISVTALK